MHLFIIIFIIIIFITVVNTPVELQDVQQRAPPPRVWTQSPVSAGDTQLKSEDKQQVEGG